MKGEEQTVKGERKEEYEGRERADMKKYERYEGRREDSEHGDREQGYEGRERADMKKI